MDINEKLNIKKECGTCAHYKSYTIQERCGFCYKISNTEECNKNRVVEHNLDNNIYARAYINWHLDDGLSIEEIVDKYV